MAWQIVCQKMDMYEYEYCIRRRHVPGVRVDAGRAIARGSEVASICAHLGRGRGMRIYESEPARAHGNQHEDLFTEEIELCDSRVEASACSAICVSF